MTLSALQKSLVQRTFSKLAVKSDSVAEMFYQYLFQLDPDLQTLFRRDPKLQGRKLMQVLAVTVNTLDNPEQLFPIIEALGERHDFYGVKVEDYSIAGAALLWSIECHLGSEFTPEVAEAWSTLYTLLAQILTKKHYDQPAE